MGQVRLGNKLDKAQDLADLLENEANVDELGMRK